MSDIKSKFQAELKKSKVPNSNVTPPQPPKFTFTFKWLLLNIVSPTILYVTKLFIYSVLIFIGSSYIQYRWFPELSVVELPTIFAGVAILDILSSIMKTSDK